MSLSGDSHHTFIGDLPKHSFGGVMKDVGHDIGVGSVTAPGNELVSIPVPHSIYVTIKYEILFDFQSFS